ncbi:MAG TPA: hypothetical protein DE315_03515 [Candidatus Omnitrophica bacterium]|nr:MAG: hypothetical protein A2Y05_00460 [Omnitrophica WOR_2 bacterium GWA2_53_43]HBO96572.1 hypothetical protein [Candidatus Omnitrophota bacterium]HCI44583.1 hypothetical protein [Candidatus Omnitrophota bacterium]
MKIVMVLFGILFSLQGLIVLKNKRFGTDEGNLGLRGVVRGKVAIALGSIFTLIGLVLIILSFTA